jgi:hypothetical protein
VWISHLYRLVLLQYLYLQYQKQYRWRRYCDAVHFAGMLLMMLPTQVTLLQRLALKEDLLLLRISHQPPLLLMLMQSSL